MLAIRWGVGNRAVVRRVQDVSFPFIQEDYLVGFEAVGDVADVAYGSEEAENVRAEGLRLSKYGGCGFGGDPVYVAGS